MGKLTLFGRFRELVKRDKSDVVLESIITSIRDNTIKGTDRTEIDVDYMLRIFREDVLPVGGKIWTENGYFFLDGGYGVNTIIDISDKNKIYKVSGLDIYEIEMPRRRVYSYRVDTYNMVSGSSHRRNVSGGIKLDDEKREDLVERLKYDAPLVHKELASQYPAFDKRKREEELNDEKMSDILNI